MPKSPSNPGSDTAEAILDAAEFLFAAKGYDAVPIKAIARRARVNVSLIYYYHDSKQTLYRHVIERIARDLVSRASGRLMTIAAPADAIRAVPAAQFEMLSAKPHIAPLLLREMVDYHASHAVGALREFGAALFRRLCDVISEGQKRGAFRRDVDPQFAAFSTMAQLPYFFLARPALGALAESSGHPFDESTAAAYAAHAGEFAVAALRANQ